MFTFKAMPGSIRRERQQGITHGRHTLGIEGKGVLSIGVLRVVVGNRVGVGINRSTINPLPPSYFPVKGASE